MVCINWYVMLEWCREIAIYMHCLKRLIAVQLSKVCAASFSFTTLFLTFMQMGKRLIILCMCLSHEIRPARYIVP